MRRRFFNNMLDTNLNYLSFTSEQDGSSISLVFHKTPPDIKYSLNGADWVQWDYNAITLNTGDIVRMKGNNSSFSLDGNDHNGFSMSGKISASGNIMSLLYEDNFRDKLKIPHAHCFYRLFADCESLTTAPELPATTLAPSCYTNMFNGCTNLTTAPELPATILEYGCYEGMFYGCTSLVNAPELPATILEYGCYEEMFYGCTNLNYIKMLATDISAIFCLSLWVYGVSPTGTFVKSKDATWNVVGDSGVPNGWTVKTDDEESGGNSLFPATIIYSYNNENIPNYTIAKYFIDTYPDMVVGNSGAYTPITEDVTIQGSNYCDGKVVGVAKWVNGEYLLFYTENSISKWFALSVYVDYGSLPNGCTGEFFTD